MDINQIYAPVLEDLNKVKDTLKSISRIDYEWLSEQLSYVVGETGKGIRPALTLLSGKSYKYNLTSPAAYGGFRRAYAYRHAGP